MAKWDAALYTEKLLKKSTLEQMWSPTKLKDGKTQDYGFGWALSKQNGHREVGHGGGIPGFSTYIGRYLDDKLTIIVLANSDFANAQALARGIAQTYLPDLAPQPEKALVDADPKIAERMRKLLRDTMENKLDLTQFTDEARPRIQEGVKGAQQLLKSLGALQKVEIVRKEERDGLQFSHFRLVFERDTLRGLLGIDKEGKIAAIGLSPGE
jgi:CubicO group peptidase (beta-lactamase class C family)